MRVQRSQKNDYAGEVSQAIITVNIELVRLSPNAFTIHLTVEPVVLDSSDQVKARDVGAHGEIGGTNFEDLATRFVAGVLVPVVRRSEIACCGEEVQILWSRRGEIYEPTEPRSIMDGRGGLARRSTHTPCTSCDTTRGGNGLRVVIWRRCREEDDQKSKILGGILAERGWP